MIVCPKCQFQGTDPEQCEKCGIIFDRMHTIVDLRPLGALGQALAARGAKAARPVDPDEVTQVASPNAAPSPQAPPKPVPAAKPPAAPAPPSPAVPLVPRVERAPEPGPRLRGWLVVLLVVALGVTVASEVLDRREAARAADEASDRAQTQQLDAAYFDLACEALLTEGRRDLRRIEDPARAEEVRLRLASRVAHLTQRLNEAPLGPTERARYADALAALREFLADDVPPAIAAAKELGARAEPTSSQALERAAAVLAAAHP